MGQASSLSEVATCIFVIDRLAACPTSAIILNRRRQDSRFVAWRFRASFSNCRIPLAEDSLCSILPSGLEYPALPWAERFRKMSVVKSAANHECTWISPAHRNIAKRRQIPSPDRPPPDRIRWPRLSQKARHLPIMCRHWR